MININLTTTTSSFFSPDFTTSIIKNTTPITFPSKAEGVCGAENDKKNLPAKRKLDFESNGEATANSQDIPNENATKRTRKSSTTEYKNESKISNYLNNSIKDAQVEVDQLQQELTKEIEYRSKLKSDYTNLTQKLNNLENLSQHTIEAYESKLNSLTQEKEQSDKNVLDLQVKLSMETTTLSMVSSLLLKNQEQNEKLKDQQERIDYLTNQINNLNKKVFDLENENKGNESNQKFENESLLKKSSKLLEPVKNHVSEEFLDLLNGVKRPMKSTNGVGSPSSATSSNLDASFTENSECAQQ